MDVAMLIVRVVVGALFMGHGAQKLFGWFRGHGLPGTGGWLESVGYRSGVAMATLAGVAELASGALLALGLLTPLAAAGIIGMMVSATLVVHLRQGLWVSEGGFEYPLVLSVIAFAVALAGPGRYSVDAAAGLPTGGLAAALGALALGLGAALVLNLLRTPAALEEATEETVEERRAA